MGILGFLVVLSSQLFASSLPANLSASDLLRVIEIVGVPVTQKLMRSAEAYPSFPGAKIGVEVFTLRERGINAVGDQTGDLPTFSPVPRIYLSKGLFLNTELVVSFFPTSDVNPVGSLGVVLKHSFYDELQNWMTVGGYFGFTSINGFEGQYTGSNFELGAVVSKDFVRLKPYAGVGIILARGQVPLNQLAATNRDNIAWLTTVHSFIGMELETPLNFAFQVDLFDMVVGASFFVGKKF